jgi:LemA protein
MIAIGVVLPLLALLGLLAVAAKGVALYNLLVRDRARVDAAWSDVEVQLKRRYDLVPKLVEAARQHAGFERGVLERVAQGRAQALQAEGAAGKRVPEGALGRDLQRLVALAEAYPDLTASRSFLELQRNLSEIEDDIQFARRYYNGSVNNLNTRVDTFPDLLLARLFGFRAAEYFELERAAEAQPVEVR